jgi:tetratricopeptide (TPR) repeat protein
MSLLLNLEGAKQQVTSQLTNKNLIDSLNKFGEEYFRTVGIIFYCRYQYYLHRDNKVPEPEIVELITNYFQEPTFDSWIRLSNLCCNQLSQFGDQLAQDYIKICQKRIESPHNQQAQKIIKEIHRLKSNLKFCASSKITLGDLGEELMRLLRNFHSHEWTDDGLLQPLVDLDIRDFLIIHIDELMKPFNNEILIPKMFDPSKGQKSHLKVYLIKNSHVEVLTMPIDTSLFSFDQPYFRFNPQEDRFGCPSNLILFDEVGKRIFTYTKMKKEGEAIYTNVPLVGEIRSIPKKFKGGITELFEIPQQNLQQEKLVESLRDKYGPVNEETGIFHNLPPLVKTYVPRPVLEKKLIDALKLQRSYIFTIDGGGGYGKTELVKKVAWDIIHNTLSDEIKDKFQFGHVFWISGKSTYFVRGEVEEKQPALNRLEDLLDCIFYVTGKFQYLEIGLEEKKKYCIEILNSLGSFLLIIDNLETVSDIEEVSDFIGIKFDSINRNCNFKVVITSRVSKIEGERRVNVTTMEDDETLQLIREELQRWDILEKFNTKEQMDEISRISGRIPLIVIHIISILKNKANLNELKKNLQASMKKPLDFTCEYQWNQLSDDAEKLAKAIALNGGRINFGLAKMVCDFNDEVRFQDARNMLQDRAFLIDSDLNINVLSMLPPIYEYSYSRLRQTPTVEHELKQMLKLMKSVLEPSIRDFPISNQQIPDEIDLQNLLIFASDRERVHVYPEAYKFYNLATKNYPWSVAAWRARAKFEFMQLQDDEKARESFEKAIQLNPNDPFTYKEYAYWEFDRGEKQGEIGLLKKAIDLNNKAKDLLKDSATIRVTNDHIVSAYMKLVYIHKDLAQTNLGERNYHFSIAEKYIETVIKILEENFVQEPESSDDVRHNVIDYNLLSNAYLNYKGNNDKNRKFFDYHALVNIIKGLKLDRNNLDLKRKLDTWRIKKILETYGIKWIHIEEKNIRDIFSLLPKIESDLERMKVV